MNRKRKIALCLLNLPTAALIATTGCSKSPAAAAGGSSASVLTKSMSKLQDTVANETPRVKQDTGTAANDSSFLKWERKLFKGLQSEIYPEAVASSPTTGLSNIWDPSNLYTGIGNVLMGNLWNGGSGACPNPSPGASLSAVTCTNGQKYYESVKDWMGQAMNPQFQNSNDASTTVFGRLAHATSVGCVIGALVPAASTDTDGLPVVGTLTLTFPSSASDPIFQSGSGGCGMEAQMAGQSITLTVSAITGSALFNKLLTVTLPGGNNSSLYMKLDSANGVFNYMEAEDQRPDGREAVSRTIAVINGQKTMFEYISLGTPTATAGFDPDYPDAACVTGSGQNQQTTCGFELYRIYIDEAADEGYLLANYGGADNSSNYTRYAAAGKPVELSACHGGTSCGHTVALSMKLKSAVQITGTNTTNGFDTTSDPTACVDVGTGDISTDDTLACEVTGTTVSDATAIDGEWALYSSNVITTLLDHTSAATTLSFTGPSDFYTAVPSQ